MDNGPDANQKASELDDREPRRYVARVSQRATRGYYVSTEQSSGDLPRALKPRRPMITLDDLDSPPERAVGPVAQPTQAEAVCASTPRIALPPVKAPRAQESYCRACGAAIDSRAVICTQCGVATPNALDAGVAAAAVAMNHKSPGTAMVLSLLFTGAGQMYCGKVGRGLAFLAAALLSAVLILAVVGLILLPAVWIWAMVDAYQLATRQNQALLATVRGV